MTTNTNTNTAPAYDVHTLGHWATSALLEALCALPDTDAARSYMEEAETLLYRMQIAADGAEAVRLPGAEAIRSEVEEIEKSVKKVMAKVVG